MPTRAALPRVVGRVGVTWVLRLPIGKGATALGAPDALSSRV